MSIRFLSLPILVVTILSACSSQAPQSSTTAVSDAATVTSSTGSSTDTCKDFPASELIYPSRTSCSSDKGDSTPTRYTLALESADPIDKVTAWYQTEPKSGGWTVKESDPAAMTPTHTVVSLENGKGYATATLFSQGTGTSLQVHLYPNGNEE